MNETTTHHTNGFRRGSVYLCMIALPAVLGAVLVAGACGGGSGSTETASSPATIPQPSQAQLAAADLAKLPLAPESERLDLEAPVFSDPTQIDNPLFPVSDLHSTVFSGKVDDLPFHTETTLLPETRLIEWSEGQQVEAAVSQYFAYIDGRIEEVALDYYAQADDGSVWYLGEDVLDYNREGLIDGTAGSWLAGREGPPEMIMPADPQVGDVHRAENIPAIAFEEVTIKRVGKTVPGPSGPVEGAMVADELHDDGTFSDKVFAPGYGEFFTAHGGEVEAMALAVPTDALGGPVPPELESLSSLSLDLFGSIRADDWASASTSARQVAAEWKTLSSGDVPPRIAAETGRAVRALAAAIDQRDRDASGNAAIDVGQSALDLQLRHRPPAEVDYDRFELWTRQILVHADAGDLGGVNGDVATLEWIRDRFAHVLEAADLTSIDVHIDVLRESVVDEDIEAAAAEAADLRETLEGISPTSGP